jgi:hypothetical protein
LGVNNVQKSPPLAATIGLVKLTVLAALTVATETATSKLDGPSLQSSLLGGRYRLPTTKWELSNLTTVGSPNHC